MGIKLNYNESTLGKKLAKIVQNADDVFTLYVATKVTVMESYMKENRPWGDDTGAAKARLIVSDAPLKDGKIRITFAHGVKHGIWLEKEGDGTVSPKQNFSLWLELAKEKKYAIIAPTIRKFAPEIIEDLKEIFGKIVI